MYLCYTLTHSEFEENGLARYGAELEEDEEDRLVARELAGGKLPGFAGCSWDSKPPSGTVAYDSELDMDE